MTEKIEEQAEEYITKEYCENCIWKNACNSQCEKVKKCKQDFYAGAKWGIANATQWHDLRKNPNDLPTKNGEYCCFVYEHGYEIHRFNTFKNCFLGVFSRVIKWCELPIYKE